MVRAISRLVTGLIFEEQFLLFFIFCVRAIFFYTRISFVHWFKSARINSRHCINICKGSTASSRLFAHHIFIVKSTELRTIASTHEYWPRIYSQPFLLWSSLYNPQISVNQMLWEPFLFRVIISVSFVGVHRNFHHSNIWSLVANGQFAALLLKLCNCTNSVDYHNVWANQRYPLSKPYFSFSVFISNHHYNTKVIKQLPTAVLSQ